MSLATPVIVAHKDDENMMGVMISMDIIMTPIKMDDGTIGMKEEVKCGVLWNDHRTPAPSIHPSSDLSWVEVPGVTDTDEDEEEDSDEADSEEGDGEPEAADEQP